MEKIVKKRNILSVYYRHKEVVQSNRAVHANSAVLRCVDHMQLNHYDATLVEVFDTSSGVLHAVVKRNTQGLQIIYKREVREGDY